LPKIESEFEELIHETIKTLTGKPIAEHKSFFVEK